MTMMKNLFFICLFWLSFPLSAEQNLVTMKKHWILAQNGLSDAFDPFIDYGEFQDNVAERRKHQFFSKWAIS